MSAFMKSSHSGLVVHFTDEELAFPTRVSGTVRGTLEFFGWYEVPGDQGAEAAERIGLADPFVLPDLSECGVEVFA